MSALLCRLCLGVAIVGLLATTAFFSMATEYLLLGVGWSVVFGVSATAIRFAREVPARIARRVDVHAPKEEGFRVTARSAQVHRIVLGVGEEGFVNLGAFVATTGAISLSAITYGMHAHFRELIGWGALGTVFWVLGLPIAAYVFLQSRRSIEVERGRITVRGWLGIPRRILVEEGISVSRTPIVSDARDEKADVFRIAIHVGKKRLFVARMVGKEAPALMETLRASISEVSELAVNEGVPRRTSG